MLYRYPSYLFNFVLAAILLIAMGLPVNAISAVAVGNEGDPWSIIAVNMQESLAAYRKGQSDEAYQLAATAYLDGFELLEDRLKEVDVDLMKTIEQGMEQIRSLIRQGAPTQVVENQNAFVQNLLSQARGALDAADGGR